MNKLLFVTPHGLFVFKDMHFGLCNAPATFERMIDRVLKGVKWTTCLSYLDDVIIFSSSFSSHLQRLAKMVTVFCRANIHLNSPKYIFRIRNMKILAQLLDKNGVEPNLAKILAVSNVQTPANSKNVQSFASLCCYFRRFIAQFSNISSPPTELLKKDANFHWGA